MKQSHRKHSHAKHKRAHKKRMGFLEAVRLFAGMPVGF